MQRVSCHTITAAKTARNNNGDAPVSDQTAAPVSVTMPTKVLQDLLAILVPLLTAASQFLKDERSYEVIFLSFAFLALYGYVRSLLGRIDELKITVVTAATEFSALRKKYEAYAQVSNTTIANLFSDLSAMAGDRQIGSLTVHAESGAMQYIKLVMDRRGVHPVAGGALFQGSPATE